MKARRTDCESEPPHGQVSDVPRPLEAAGELADALRSKIKGDVRFDALARTIYASDASIYEITPAGVVLPKDVDDVVTTLRLCQAHGIPVVARGAGTGLTGGAVGQGVLLDLSRFMNRVGPLDQTDSGLAGTVVVEPGVVLDELNALLEPMGLIFAPDVATGSRATIGGMIANNSCGAHSILYGRTVDHVVELTVVLADGEIVTFYSPPVPSAGNDAPTQDSVKASDRPATARSATIERELSRIRDRYHPEIQRRFPRILRSNGGYGLDRLGTPGTPADAVKILCGSEGTLGIIVGAKLRLTALPKQRGLVVLHFDELLDALAVTSALLEHHPAAIELIDRTILQAGRSNGAINRRCGFLKGNAAALVVVEFFDDEAGRLESKVDALAADDAARGRCVATTRVLDPDQQKAIWELRKAGLGLLMSKPGDQQPYAFVEDTAVDPLRLRDYIERFREILRRESVDAGYYAHISVGCLHVRPVLSLKNVTDVQRMRRIAEAVSDLAMEFGGTMTGEHGDGLLRSCWLDKMYGPEITAAFQEVKRLFDPDGLLNPHKIVDPHPMTEHLRYGASFRSEAPKTTLDFTANGGMDGLAAMCSGVGQCRQKLVGTMCPSFMATNDEQQTTRARANALRVALSNRGLLHGLDDAHLADVMDLCLMCKACKSECPTGVDMARLKAEYLSHRNLRFGVSRRARLVADMPGLARLASRFPRTSNVVAQSRTLRGWMERRYGFDRRMEPPRFAHRTFRAWYRRHRRPQALPKSQRGRVVYFVDTWTNYFTPKVGIAAVTLLERAGFDVLCPETLCCGRSAISKGLLAEAKGLAQTNLRILSHVAGQGVPIVGTEPSCILTLQDEYPQLVRTHFARRIASQVEMIESFLRRTLDDEPTGLRFKTTTRPLVYHAHCHQKAIVGASDAVELLSAAWGPAAREINSGCCGMAGSFGYEKEHYEVARAIGEERLFPEVRECGDACVAVSGFSCRQHIEHHTGAVPRHLIEYLAENLQDLKGCRT